MKRLVFILFCLIIIVSTSCKKSSEELPMPEYIIFGHFYGLCRGEKCIEIFRLEKDRLFEDTNDKYPNSINFYAGNYVQLTQQKFIDTKDLFNSFPKDLLSEKNNVIGQPDAGDWGGLYVECNFNGIRKFWLIDQMKSNVPSKYHNFIDKMNEKIKQLQ
jgi:hypothetical protein